MVGSFKNVFVDKGEFLHFMETLKNTFIIGSVPSRAYHQRETRTLSYLTSQLTQKTTGQTPYILGKERKFFDQKNYFPFFFTYTESKSISPPQLPTK
jgi:hypothetical protein